MTAAANWVDKFTPELGEEELLFFCGLIEERAGIHLKSAKLDLVRTRLRSRIQHHGMTEFSEYKDLLSSLNPNDPEWEIFTNLLTTNKTDFFREQKHFEVLVNCILPEWLKGNEKTFLVWSAACSTGEEPYTLAMVLSRYMPEGREFKILATDIDTDVLKVAQNGVYPISKKAEIPPEYAQSSIDIGGRSAKGWFRIKPKLKDRIVFKQHNLISPASPGKEVFDLVLCRNVLIYFKVETIDFVQSKLYQATKNEGHLFIGHSESLQSIGHQWKVVSPSVFRK